MERIAEEKKVVEKMIRLYCHRKEGNKTLCPDCSEVLDYAVARLEHCRFGDSKPTCKKCPVHCYKPEMKERIRGIMRWSGPRMMLYHPVDAIRHLARESESFYKPAICVIAAIVIALIVSFAAEAQVTDPASNSTIENINNRFQGTYKEVNTGLTGPIVSLILDGDEFFLGLEGLFDVAMSYIGKAEAVKYTDRGFSFDCVLTPAYNEEGIEDAPAHVTLTQQPMGLYELQVSFEKKPDEQLGWLARPITLYKCNGYMIDGKVPSKLGEKVTIAGLLNRVAPYMYTPELMATVMYLKDRSGLCETEVVRQDEHNRYLEYAWGEMSRCMECKYWFTDDGNILLVINTHDATYEYPQSLRFFLFNRADGTLSQLETALSDKWPLAGSDRYNDICYQVRYYSDGIVALVPQTDGDSFDIVTLKFDGKIFK